MMETVDSVLNLDNKNILRRRLNSMQKTYRNFVKLSELFAHQGMTVEDVAVMYEAQDVDNRDPVLLSYVFCKLFPYMIRTTSKYYHLTEADIASLCVEELHASMIDYESDRGAKLITLFDRYINRRLVQATKDLAYDKRKANVNVSEFETSLANYEHHDLALEEIELLESIKQMNLTEREIKYCEIVLKSSGKVNNSDIAKTLGITSAGIKYIRDSLCKKLDFAV